MSEAAVGSDDTWAIIQVRTGSTRLPGKVLERLGGEPALSHVIRRAKAIPGVTRVIVATTVEPDDDAVEDFVQTLFDDVPVVRGSVEDVLGRYALALGDSPPPWFVRVTGDSPLLSFEHAGTMRKAVMERGADGANAHHHHTGVTTGFNTELYRSELLVEAARRANSPTDREHVTTWIQRQDDFEILYPAPVHDIATTFRLTLDYPEDLEVLQHVYDALYDGDLIPSEAAIAFLREHPEIAAINADCVHNVVR